MRPLACPPHRRLRDAPRALLAALGVATALAAAPGPFAAAAPRGADGRFESRRSAHFRLLQDVAIDRSTGPSGSRRFEREVLGVLEHGYARLDDLLGLRPRRRLDVYVWDAGVFDRSFAGRFRFPAAGFYHGTIHVRGGVRVSAALAATLHHELVHAALDAAAPSLARPAWLEEGLAEWFERRVAGLPVTTARDHAWLAARAAEGAWLPIAALSGASFARLDADGAALAYRQSRALVEHAERLGGRRVLADLLRLLFRTGDLDRALERTIGTDARGLEADYLAALGLPPP